MESKVLPCKCQNEYQDKQYGKNRRVHNPIAIKGKFDDKYRCTVCGAEKDVKSSNSSK